jgi:YtoQ family protein
MQYSVYLSGEIHTDWRERIVTGISEAGLAITCLAPVTNHQDSDAVGVRILGEEEQDFWKDHKAAKINSLRTNTMIAKADLVVVRFGDKYKQWNAAFEAGIAIGLGKPIIVIHDPQITHPLKEIDGAAMAVTQTPEQVVEILKYIAQ